MAYPITIKKNAPFTRTEFQIFLEKKNIQTRVVFTGNITRCCLQHIEWVSSNCEDYTIIDSFLKKINIDKKYTKLFTSVVYSCIILIIFLRFVFT